MKKITFLKQLSLLIGLFCAVNFGFGQSIFTNPITGTNPNLSNPYITGQTHDGNITVTGISRGTEIGGSNANDRYNANSWNTPSLDPDAYFEFTLTPNSGFEIDFIDFLYTSQRSNVSISNFAFRSSIDGFSSNIGTPDFDGTTIDLTSSVYQNISSSITFRFYAWGADAGTRTFSINDFTFNGTVSLIGTCSVPQVTWTSSGWDNAGVGPNINTPAVIDANYNTSSGNITACSLTVNTGATLTVSDGTFVEVENDVIVDGTLVVESAGNFVQNDDDGTFTVNIGGSSRVNKQTAPKAEWYYYTYWSSPVIGQTIANAFPDVDGDRRFWFNAANFVDTNGDDIDDNGDDWQYAYGTDVMQPGVGYASTEVRFHPSGGTGTASFEGEFNTGNVDVTITSNPANTGIKWNFIGNPYPSAVDFVAFQAANATVLNGSIYYWSQATPPSASNPGNQQFNFSLNDYAIYTAGTGGVKAGANSIMPNGFIPSGQGFFIASLIDGTATFTNAMRMADETSNSQFFKNSNSKKKTNSISENKLWIELTSDNGVYNQVLVGYVDKATDSDDGMFYDAPRLPSDVSATLYSTIEGSNKKFAIQGKDVNSLNEDEIIKLGFKSTVNVATLFTLSISDLQGDFLNSNIIYLKDNLLNKTHNLSASNYTFTSAVGEFNDRFVVTFSNQALGIEDVLLNKNTLNIVQLNNEDVQFKTSNNLTIKTVTIFDMLGRQLYSFKAENNQETFKLSNLNNSVFIAKVVLSNGAVISKKAFKK